ncbi:MAG: DNA gyrase subunit A [Saprospiraceae bacterium]
MASTQRIVPISIEEEMKSAYIDYAMSVIVSRALPDVRDGLKPVHRRVLYGMNGLGLSFSKSHKKSARIVGEVLGKYHPHGDTSVYDAMVRMAQDWSLRYPLVNGQGNFGSMDGDSPAAMRYTEAKMAKITDLILNDIDKDTVDFSLNFDDTLKEPTVLPTKLPNLLINGATGIAVGMATNMMPHNLTEVVNGIIATIENPEIDIDGLMEHITAPDFPTGGTIYGMTGVREAFETGRGRVIVRAKAIIEEKNGREVIIVNEIPFQVNKANLIIKIADLVNDGKVEGISALRDESDRNGLRIVVECKRDAMASVVLAKLFKYTPLQTSYGVNNVCLVNGRPRTLNLRQIIDEFIKFRIEVVVRRTQYELRKAQERAHILEGLLIALDHLDEVIKLIRGSKDVEAARNGLMSTFELSEIQARAILDMRLQKLTGLERDKVRAEFDELMVKIAYYESILASETLQKEIITEELLDVKENFGDERRTDISFADGDINMEDLIANEEVVITISNLGYIKRTISTEFRAQSRGGRGSRGSKTRDTDFVEHMFVAYTHNYLLLFTEQGRCFWLRGFDIPEASKASAGRVIQNILAIPKEDKVKAYIIVPDLTDEAFLDSRFILFATRQGVVKKTSLRAYSRVRQAGIRAININEGDMLLEAKLTRGDSQIVLATQSGYAIRFEETRVRSMGRTSTGVRGVSLQGDDDKVVGMIVLHEDGLLAADAPAVDVEAVEVEGSEAETVVLSKTILVISENGMGKRSDPEEYRITNRGGKGVRTMQITEKTGALVSVKAVTEADDLMVTTKDGIVIRLPVEQMRVMGRATQGVRVIKLQKKDAIADVAVVPHNEEEESEEE